MNSHIPLTVVMPVYNSEAFLTKAIESILNQTYKDFEFLIIDDASSDNSHEILREYEKKDNRIRIYREKENCGCAAAQNKASEMARGDYIAQMDADDVAFPDRLEKQMSFLKDHPNVAVLGGAMILINENDTPIGAMNYPLCDRGVKRILPYRSAFSHPTTIKKKEAFWKVKGYRRIFRQGSDYDLWLRMARHFEFANLSDPLIYYRIHPSQVSVKHLEQHVLFILGAQASDKLRRQRGYDPIDEIKEINHQSLARLGMTQQQINNTILEGRLFWTDYLLKAGQLGVALSLMSKNATLYKTESLSKQARVRYHLTLANLHYRKKKLLHSLFSAAKAFLIQPREVAALFSPVVRRRLIFVRSVFKKR